MNDKAKPTPGKWEIAGKDGDSHVICAKDKHGKRRTLAHAYTEGDAELIAEAGTVYHETGLTPREILAQRDRLARALEAYLRAGCKNSRRVASVLAKSALANTQPEGREG